MTAVTYHVVVPFDCSDDGDLVPGEAAEAPNADAARRRVVIDQIASLTDTSAIAWHHRLCVPGAS